MAGLDLLAAFDSVDHCLVALSLVGSPPIHTHSTFLFIGEVVPELLTCLLESLRDQFLRSTVPPL